eukprot:SAG11_NODE_35687_length_265_cov_0.939759_1_plen_64_part_10
MVLGTAVFMSGNITRPCWGGSERGRNRCGEKRSILAWCGVVARLGTFLGSGLLGAPEGARSSTP